jgi:site-specific DNA-methyltransferase (adenine-specific)
MKNRNLNHKDDWQTPSEFYDLLNKEFDFNFDPCPYQHNVDLWDGIKIDWGERSYINPPYSQKLKEAFVIKAIEQSQMGKLCVCLLPVSTSTKLFHNYILPNMAEIRFLKKRIKFLGVNTRGEAVSNKSGMHDSMLVIFDGRMPKQTPRMRLS